MRIATNLDIEQLQSGQNALLCKRSLLNYIWREGALAASKAIWNQFWSDLEKKTCSFTIPLFVCPAGFVAQDISRQIINLGGSVQLFFDGYKTGVIELNSEKEDSYKIPVTRFSDISEFLGQEICLGVFSGSYIGEEIIEKLHEIGFMDSQIIVV